MATKKVIDNKETMYRVKVIAISLNNQKTAKYDEVFPESLLSTHPDELMKGGFVEEVKEGDVSADKKPVGRPKKDE